MQSEQINELALALSKAQGEFSSAEKDRINPHFKSSYATLNSVWEACREGLAKQGLSVIQTMDGEDDLKLITLLAHSSGQWIKSILPIAYQKITPQALGSAITYMRRYALSAIVGIAPGDDDDGNQAQEASKNTSPTIKRNHATIDQEKLNAFAAKHELFESNIKNAPPSFKREYLLETCTKSKTPEIEVVIAMMKNESGFEKTFEAWMKSKFESEKNDEKKENV